MDFSPGAFNIVPARVGMALEFRAPDENQFGQLEEALLALAGESAARYGLGLESEFLSKHPPAPMSKRAQTAIAAAAESLGLDHIPLTSGAGHDAQSLAPLCPAGMIFVPSQGGASHSAREFTEWVDCVNGANTLLRAALVMATGE
jgi:N-carbamoyl-L-amino-acid hydrolase